MNIINSYLDTMFSAYPQTTRLLEAKTELQGMMEDAYTSLIAAGRSENEAVGQVIRDFGNLDEVAPVLGITSDISPAVAPGSEPGSAQTALQYPPVTLAQGQGYASAMERVRYRLATAIMLFVLSPAALIVLTAASGSGLLSVSDAAGVFIGIMVILVMAALAVVLLLAVSRETAPYKSIPEAKFTANPVVTRWAQTLAEEHEPRRIRALQIAIMCWILAPIPIIGFSLFLTDSVHGGVWTSLGVVIVLVMVATGLRILLPHVWAHTVAEELGRGKGGSVADDGESSIVGVIAAIYWPLLTAIYLAWSFIGNAWHISWVIWPVAGIVFGAIAAGTESIAGYRRNRR